jgi:hypothetical protein
MQRAPGRVIAARATPCGLSGAEGIDWSVMPLRLAVGWFPARCLGDGFGVPHASPHHAMNAPGLPDIALRIGIQDQEVSAFARFESAQIGSAAHGAGTALAPALRIARGAARPRPCAPTPGVALDLRGIRPYRSEIDDVRPRVEPARLEQVNVRVNKARDDPFSAHVYDPGPFGNDDLTERPHRPDTLPPATSTTASRRGVFPVPSISVAPTKTVTPVWGPSAASAVICTSNRTACARARTAVRQAGPGFSDHRAMPNFGRTEKRSRGSLFMTNHLRLYCPARSRKLFFYGVWPGEDAAGLSVPVARVVEIAFEGMHDPVQPCGQRGVLVLYDLVGLLPCPLGQEIYRSA